MIYPAGFRDLFLARLLALLAQAGCWARSNGVRRFPSTAGNYSSPLLLALLLPLLLSESLRPAVFRSALFRPLSFPRALFLWARFLSTLSAAARRVLASSLT